MQQARDPVVRHNPHLIQKSKAHGARSSASTSQPIVVNQPLTIGDSALLDRPLPLADQAVPGFNPTPPRI
jgi:hypothetical protein